MIVGLWRFLKGSLHGAFCRDLLCDCRREESLGVAVGTCDSLFLSKPSYDFYSSVPVILKRFPKYPLGAKLKRGPVVGVVHTIYADYEAAVAAYAVPSVWFDAQTDPPSSKDQVFYGITIVAKWKERIIVMGAILVGENDVELARDEDIQAPVEA